MANISGFPDGPAAGSGAARTLRHEPRRRGRCPRREFADFLVMETNADSTANRGGVGRLDARR